VPKKIDRPTKFPWRSSGAGFLAYNREILVDGQEILVDGQDE